MLLVLALTAVTNFGSNPGALDMFEHVPANLPAGSPLVVVLHGCTQQATSMEAAGWNALADEHDFAVVYAQQRGANNQLNCFSWYEAGDIARGAGEAESIAQMVDTAIAKHGVSRDRIYVTGVSAGGAFSAVLLATYPDRFRAGSIIAGLPYKAMLDGQSKTPEEWGGYVRAAYAHDGTYPRVQIWHGSQDYTVPASNATELVKQWTNVWGTDQTADATETIHTTKRTRYMAGATLAVELNFVEGMGHAIPIGDDAMGTCPAKAGAFYSDVKICSTLRAAQFFGLLGDTDGDGDGDGDGSGSGSGSGSGAGGEGGGCNAGSGVGSGLIALLALVRRRRKSSLASQPWIRERFITELRRRRR